MDEEIWGRGDWPIQKMGRDKRGIFFNEMFVFLIIQDDFKKKLIKLVNSRQNMTQTFLGENRKRGKEKKSKIKIVGLE